MRRRQFITFLGSAFAAWPSMVGAQAIAKIPRVGVLWHAGSAEEEGRYFTGLIEGLLDWDIQMGRTLFWNIVFQMKSRTDFGKWPPSL
jgi:putative ABC transport system substrate-binding protein